MSSNRTKGTSIGRTLDSRIHTLDCCARCGLLPPRARRCSIPRVAAPDGATSAPPTAKPARRHGRSRQAKTRPNPAKTKPKPKQKRQAGRQSHEVDAEGEDRSQARRQSRTKTRRRRKSRRRTRPRPSRQRSRSPRARRGRRHTRPAGRRGVEARAAEGRRGAAAPILRPALRVSRRRIPRTGQHHHHRRRDRRLGGQARHRNGAQPQADRRQRDQEEHLRSGRQEARRMGDPAQRRFRRRFRALRRLHRRQSELAEHRHACAARPRPRPSRSSRPTPRCRRYFSQYPPLSAKGRFALARALLASGNRKDAEALVREAWRYDGFSQDVESRIVETLRRVPHPRRSQGAHGPAALRKGRHRGRACAPRRGSAATSRRSPRRASRCSTKGGNKAALDAVPAAARNDIGYKFAPHPDAAARRRARRSGGA